ncbi:ribokinase [Pelagibacterium sediminicola]|uniref:ribokinase n=1 Tax=Pelagibacterium sediminicola TaxID=2248761 RepID=UPI000E30F3DB|nr:ribokinase [Pelagibacterium sediminicola]
MIVVYGSINIDVIGHAPSLMRPGETVLGTTLEIAPGGKGANQALAAARAGGEVRMIGCVGHDDFATQALALLSESGMDLDFVRRMDRHTGTALIVVDDAGENMITVLPGANSRLSPAVLERAGLKAGDWLLLQLETPLEGILAAARYARRMGAKTILNLAPFMAFPPELLDEIDLLVVNETELGGVLEMLGAPVDDVRQGVGWLAERLGNIVVATLGGEGAISCADGKEVRVAAIAVTPVDTVGAGDTFVGYLAAGLAQGAALDTALRRATVAAGLACLKPGAQPSIPERDEVEAHMAGMA